METDLESFLTCPVCLDTLSEPVSLSCHHSFCRHCLMDFWTQNNTQNCPVCRRKSSKGHPGINFALRELCISLREKLQCSASAQEQPGPAPTGPGPPGPAPTGPGPTGPAPTGPGPTGPAPTGPGPTGPAPTGPAPTGPAPTQEKAQTEQREEAESQLKALQGHRVQLIDTKELYEDIVQHSEEQAAHCERSIRVVFSELHRFLQEEEQRAMSALREEQLRQNQSLRPEIQKVRDTLTALTDSITELEKHLQTGTPKGELFQSPQPLPQIPTGLLLDQAKVLGNLGFRVWRNMRKKVQYSPVILDPNSAKPNVHVSEDLRAVRQGEFRENLPKNPERFTNGPTVLGSEGYSSGHHQWDVEVGDHPEWTIGVMKESIDRRGKIGPAPEFGMWCLWHKHGRYNNGNVNKTLSVLKPPERIQVRLDWDRGTLSFYDADHMTHLYTHLDTFTERLFPFLCVGPTGDTTKTTELRICPSDGPQFSHS